LNLGFSSEGSTYVKTGLLCLAQEEAGETFIFYFQDTPTNTSLVLPTPQQTCSAGFLEVDFM
jgi:hypothetical protein